MALQKRKKSTAKEKSWPKLVAGLLAKVRVYLRANGLAVAAIIISIVAAVLSGWSVVEQRRQWRSTALGRVGIEECSYVPWTFYTEEELKKIEFGYPYPELNNFQEKEHTVRREAYLLSRLSLRRNGDSPLEWLGTANTMGALLTFIKENGWKSEDFIVSKQVQILIKFRKYGTTPARQFISEIEYQEPKTGEWKPFYEFPGLNEERADLFAEEPRRHILVWMIRPDEQLPKVFNIRSKISYVDVEDQPQEYSEGCKLENIL